MSQIERLKNCAHKAGVDKNDWDKVHKNLVTLAEYVLDHCETYNLPVVFSSIIRPRIKDVSKTDIHITGRAFDISVIGWSRNDIDYLVSCANDNLQIGAISSKTGLEKEAVFEEAEFDKNGKQTKWRHLHFQVRP